MTSDLEAEYKKIRAQNETLNARIEVAEESLAELYKELKEKFNCNTLEEAAALQAKLTAAQKKIETRIEDALASVLD